MKAHIQSHLKHARSERGAVVAHVAIAMVGLLAFSTFALDYGVMWTARRQAQNSADAAAMAGAITLAYSGLDRDAAAPIARQRALEAAARNRIWGEAPDNASVDVFVPYDCPAGSPGAGTNACIRVDVYREPAKGNPLPTFFGNLAGVTQQGVRATATAEVMIGDSTDCVKPFAIPDKWLERRDDVAPAGFSGDDAFDRYNQQGGLLPGAVDEYRPPNGSDPGTGFTRTSVGVGGSDYGTLIQLKAATGNKVGAGFFQLMEIDCPGANCAEWNILNCNPTVVGPGSGINGAEPGAKLGPVSTALQELYNRDSSATWDPNLYGPNKGGISGGCMAGGTCAISPRLMAVGVYNTDTFAQSLGGGQGGGGRATPLEITKIIGFFLAAPPDRRGEISGYITYYPAPPRPMVSNSPQSAFVISIAMVR